MQTFVSRFEPHGSCDDRAAGSKCGGFVVILENDWPVFAQVTFEIVSEHARENMSAHTIGEAVMD